LQRAMLSLVEIDDWKGEPLFVKLAEWASQAA
jgi:hypothetical protein